MYIDGIAGAVVGIAVFFLGYALLMIAGSIISDLFDKNNKGGRWSDW